MRDWDYRKIQAYPSEAKKSSEFYVSQIHALRKRNHKKTGIEFAPDENNSYGNFVSLLNDIMPARQETCALDIEKTGHLFVITDDTDPTPEKSEYQKCLLCENVIDDVRETDAGIFFESHP